MTRNILHYKKKKEKKIVDTGYWIEYFSPLVLLEKMGHQINGSLAFSQSPYTNPKGRRYQHDSIGFELSFLFPLLHH